MGITFKSDSKEKLLEQVKMEAMNLKKNINQQERQQLDFSKLDPDRADMCVYGQMTGDCFNRRATELIRTCAQKMVKAESTNSCLILGDGVITETGSCNLPFGYRRSVPFEKGAYYSPIETFIAQPSNKNNGNNEKLLSFIKGESSTMDFVEY